MKKIIGFHLRSIKGMLACAVIYHVLVMAGLCQEHGHLDLSYYFFIWVIMAVFMIAIMASLDDPCGMARLPARCIHCRIRAGRSSARC